MKVSKVFVNKIVDWVTAYKDVDNVFNVSVLLQDGTSYALVISAIGKRNARRRKCSNPKYANKSVLVIPLEVENE